MTMGISNVAEATTCVSCGTTIPAGRARCPKCGRPRAPRWPARGFALYLHEAGTPRQEIHAQTATASAVAALPQHRPILPWIELFVGFFGFHGVGLIMAGKPTRGFIWLGLSLIKHVIGAGLIVATAGIALACLWPLDIGLSIFLALTVARLQRHAQHAALAAGG